MAGGVLFTPDELRILSEHYPTKGMKGVAAMIGRSPQAVKCKAIRLGIQRQWKRRRFTTQEIAIIRQRYQAEGPTSLSGVLNRDALSVMCKANNLGLLYSGKPTPFSAEQSEIISQQYQKQGASRLAQRLGRSPRSIAAKASKLGLSRTIGDRAVMHPVTMTNAELAYLAGIIDGEGTVTVKRTPGRDRPIPWVAIANTAEPLIDWLRVRFATPNVIVAPVTPGQRRGGYSATIPLPSWIFSFRGYNYLPLYRALLPLLVIKQPQMAMLIEYSDIRLSQVRDAVSTTREQVLVQMIRFMNSRRLRLSPGEKLRIYQCTTWEPALEHMRQTAS